MGSVGSETETKSTIKKVVSSANTKIKVTILYLSSISSGRPMIQSISAPLILTHIVSFSIIWTVYFQTKNTQIS